MPSTHNPHCRISGCSAPCGSQPCERNLPTLQFPAGARQQNQAVLGLLGILPQLLAPPAGTRGLSSKTSCSVKPVTPAPCSGRFLAGLPVQLLGEGWCPVSLCLWAGDLGCNLPVSLSCCPSGIPGIQERTLVAVKPDGVQRRLVGDVIKRFERRGFKLVGMKLLQANEGILAEHYHELRRKPFYPALIHYMTSGPVVAMVWEGYNVVRTSRAMVGDTDSAEAKPGTIRGDFSIHVSRNVVHASDSVEMAQREINLWFHSSELVDWDCCDYSNTYQL
uniref:Nucleoside diphosphate kinase n=1 Tax=Chelydra serpentina TaxID=8475 RepID=A0A8C3SZ73_CHESE